MRSNYYFIEVDTRSLDPSLDPSHDRTTNFYSRSPYFPPNSRVSMNRRPTKADGILKHMISVHTCEDDSNKPLQVCMGGTWHVGGHGVGNVGGNVGGWGES